MDISGTFTYTTNSTNVNQDFLQVQADGIITVKNGGKIIVDKSAATSSENHIFINQGGTLTFDSGSSLVGVRRIKMNGSTLILNQLNVISEVDVTFTKGSVANNLVIGANQTVKQFHFWDVDNLTINIDFDNSAILSLGQLQSTWLTKTIDFVLTDFFCDESGSSLQFTNASFITSANTVEGIAWIKKSFSAANWEDFYVDSDGWLRATAIPEPSTVAAVIGALALGFVAYRRRK